jgi:hypothetical protein
VARREDDIFILLLVGEIGDFYLLPNWIEQIKGVEFRQTMDCCENCDYCEKKS